jgi:hypothetical protein
VVDAVQPVLAEVAAQQRVQLASGGEVSPEGLLNHQPGPLGQPGLGQPVGDGAEQAGATAR